MKMPCCVTAVVLVLFACLQPALGAPPFQTIFHREKSGEKAGSISKISSESGISSPGSISEQSSAGTKAAETAKQDGISVPGLISAPASIQSPESISSRAGLRISDNQNAENIPTSISSTSESKISENSSGESISAPGSISAPAPISEPASISAPGSISTPLETRISNNKGAESISKSIPSQTPEKISEGTNTDGISAPGSISAPSDANISETKNAEGMSGATVIPSPDPISAPTEANSQISESKADAISKLPRMQESSGNSLDGGNGEGSYQSTSDPASSMAAGRTHNQDGAPRRSFADALRLIGRSSRLIRKNIPGARKAYNDGGVIGLADYVVTLPDFFRDPPVISFSNVTVARDADSATVSASMSEALPINGPPFVFSLENLLPTILEEVLELRMITNENGEQEKVLVLNDRKQILLEANADA